MPAQYPDRIYKWIAVVVFNSFQFFFFCLFVLYLGCSHSLLTLEYLLVFLSQFVSQVEVEKKEKNYDAN